VLGTDVRMPKMEIPSEVIPSSVFDGLSARNRARQQVQPY